MESINLASANLDSMNLTRMGNKVSVPGYDRKDLSPSIVHLGLGNFHRAHQAAYLDRLLERGLEKTGIFGINLIPDSFPLDDILPAQDYLYTLITRSPGGEESVRISGSILAYLNGSLNREAAIRRMADRDTGLITVTVTEKGYHYDYKAGIPDIREKEVLWDLEHPQEPKTAAACLAAALALRHKNCRSPLTIMCCDNIPHNGEFLKSCVLFYCRELYPDIIPWVEDCLSFPSSMVDRITPVTTDKLISEIEERYGISDRWPVCGEDFIQWVLEGDFRTKVPDFAEAGVQVVRDVEPYELMKMRLLNGSHAALGFCGYLMGFRMVDEAATHPLMKGFIRDHYMEQVTPTLEPVPGIDLKNYKDTLISRFSNRNIADTILRLTLFSSVRFTNFVLKPLSAAISRGLPHNALTLAVAGCARFMAGTDEQGRAIPVDGDDTAAVSEAARKARSEPRDFLTKAGTLYLNESELAAFETEFKECLNRVYEVGMEAAMAEIGAD